MKVKIDWIETKKPDWKIASLTTEANVQHKEVSINKVGKKGEVFPNFDALAPGMTVEGELWTSSAGKNYLFPPKDALSQPPRRGSSGVAQAMKQKEASIEKFQATKEDSIRTSSTARDATLILTTFYPEIANLPQETRGANIKAQWNKIRQFLLEAWEPVEVTDDNGGRYEEGMEITAEDVPF